jgi:hypothetical protein
VFPGDGRLAIFQILLPLPAIIFAVWQADTGRAKKVAATILVASDGGILPPVLPPPFQTHPLAGFNGCVSML